MITYIDQQEIEKVDSFQQWMQLPITILYVPREELEASSHKASAQATCMHLTDVFDGL